MSQSNGSWGPRASRYAFSRPTSITVKAREPLYWAGRAFRAGEVFSVTPIEAAALTYQHKAIFATEDERPTPPPPPEPEPVPEPTPAELEPQPELDALSEDEQPRRRRRYRRRDLVADEP